MTLERSMVPGTTRSENEVALSDLRRQFQAVFAADLDEWVHDIWREGFDAGVEAQEKRRSYIDAVLAGLKERRPESS